MTGRRSLSDAVGKGKSQKSGGKPLADKEIAKAVRELNENYALVLIGDKALVLREYLDQRDQPCIGFLLPSSFSLFWNKTRFPEGDREVGLGELWLRHAERRDYMGVTFVPEEFRDGHFVPPRLPNSWYNLWKGYSVQPAPFYDDYRDHVKHFQTFHDHMLKNVGRGIVEHGKFVMAWFARMIQRPLERHGVGLVLRGLQGTGKSTPGDIIGGLLPQHYALIDHPEHLVGKFNPHMVKCLFLQADEGFWAGDKTAEGRLKGLLTSKFHMVEKKGVDPVQLDNYIHLMVTSNNSWVVPAGLEERRWAVFDCGNGNIQDEVFFKRMYEELDGGGREHLLSYLLRFPIHEVNLKDLPRTQALFEQKVASMTEVQSWWFDRLREGRLLSQHGTWLQSVGVDALYNAYAVYADKLGKQRKLTKEQFGMELGKLMPSPGFRRNQKVWVQVYDVDPANGASIPSKNADGTPTKKRVNGYHIPSLADCRSHFCELARYDVDWGDDDEDDAGGGGEGGAPPPPAAGGNPPFTPPPGGDGGDSFELDDKY